MKTVLALVLALTMTPAFAQRHGGGMRGGGGGLRGGHGIGAGARSGIGGFGGGFRSGVVGGGLHRGFGTPSFRSGGFYGHRGHGFRGFYSYPYRSFGFSYPWYLGTFGYGFGWPWYGSGFGYGFGYPSSFLPYSAYTAPVAGYAGDAYGAEAMGPVIVNNNYIPERAQPPAIRTYPDYPPPPPREPEPSSAGRYPGPPPSNEPLLYLIARTDDSVIAAVAYWVDGATLHYVDRRHEHRQMPLQQVDRALSEQLNRERRVDFRLPR